MILLTVVAVGLLTSRRSSDHGSGMSVAWADARMALMLAIGELQKTTGPDGAIAAPSEIVAASPATPNLTGMGDSWDFAVTSFSLNYVGPKTQASSGTSPGVKGWLVSASSATGPKDRNSATNAFTGDTVERVGEGSLGQGALSIAKVRTCTPIVRDKHGPWKTGYPGDSEGQMLYIPIFTLHSPNNVNLKFDEMTIKTSGVSVKFTFYVNGATQQTSPPCRKSLRSTNSTARKLVFSTNKTTNGWSSPSAKCITSPPCAGCL